MALAIKYLVNTFQADGPYAQRKITDNTSNRYFFSVIFKTQSSNFTHSIMTST